MNRDRFKATLEVFFQSPQPYRHLYLWHGEANDVLALLPPGRFEQLDLYRLAAGLSRHPSAPDEAAELLRDALRAELRDWTASGIEAHPVLVVAGCELLTRYAVGLQPFYAALTGRSMVVLVCSAADAAHDPAGQLPGYVRYEPGATLAYLSRLVEDDHVVEPD